jgi:2-polyprenyl-3-methyl-5-hydroxy-6-metoxy-1,4-benzoquinol methylase
MHKINACPICKGTSFSHFLTCKDHTVSKEDFDIVKCDACGFLFTNPIPDLNRLGEYYKAEAYVSHTSSSKGLINFLYQKVRKRTLKQKVALVKSWSKGNRLLDFGCGTGHFLGQARAAGFEVTGIEPDADARKLALELNQVIAKTREEMSTISDRFDMITLWHVLEHLPELNEDIDRILSLLKVDGTLLIAVPNPSSGDALRYGANWAGYDVPRHLYHFSPEAIRDLMARHGLKLCATLPMKYDAYYVSMLSEKSMGGGVLKGFLNGFRSNRKARAGGTWSSQIYLFQRNEPLS